MLDRLWLFKHNESIYVPIADIALETPGNRSELFNQQTTYRAPVEACSPRFMFTHFST